MWYNIPRHRYHQLTRANTPVTAPFRRFFPFSPWLAPASLRLKNQKSLEKPSLTGAKQFGRSRNVSRQEKARREYRRIAKGLDAVWAHFGPSKPRLPLSTDGKEASMNQKELNEIRRRFKLDKNSISRIYGCYVNSSREIIAYIDESMGLMSQEEQEMYLGLLKKALSGGLGRNLINIEFSTAQVAGSDEHRLLQAVRQSSAQDKDAREALYRRIIDAMDMGETNYLILLAADTYDVPYKGRDDETFSDGSDTVFQYFLCSICPVKAPTLELKYNNENSGFHSASTGHIALPPELGFLFPAFDDRAANIYNALFYSKNTAEIHQEVIDAVFRVTPPLSAEEQKNAFGTALGDTLQQDCSYDVVQSVHEQLRQRIVEHKESRDPQPLTLTLHEVGDMLAGSGATVRQAEAFQEECRRQYGDDAALDARNLMESGKFQITTPEVKISVSPEYSAMIEARVIDGRKYILIPADEGVEVNGIAVNIPNPQNREIC